MIEDVTARLASFGYTVTSNDAWMLNFIITKVQKSIMHECNISAVPEGLNGIAVDMVVGEFLLNKKSMGSLEGFDLTTAVKQIQEGDTNVVFDASHSPEQRLDALTMYLMTYGKGSFSTYRCIKW